MHANTLFTKFLRGSFPSKLSIRDTTLLTNMYALMRSDKSVVSVIDPDILKWVLLPLRNNTTKNNVFRLNVFDFSTQNSLLVCEGYNSIHAVKIPCCPSGTYAYGDDFISLVSEEQTPYYFYSGLARKFDFEIEIKNMQCEPLLSLYGQNIIADLYSDTAKKFNPKTLQRMLSIQEVWRSPARPFRMKFFAPTNLNFIRGVYSGGFAIVFGDSP